MEFCLTLALPPVDSLGWRSKLETSKRGINDWVTGPMQPFVLGAARRCSAAHLLLLFHASSAISTLAFTVFLRTGVLTASAS